MEETISFWVTPPEQERLLSQVSRGLERRTEILSRQKNPKMWELADKLNGVEKEPQAVWENRRKRRAFWSQLNWILGLSLLISGFSGAAGPYLHLAVGAVCYGTGVASLWRHHRGRLAVQSMLQGVVLSLGALGDPGVLGKLLPLGVAGLAVGAAALAMRKRGGQNPFDRAARKLLEQVGEGREQLSMGVSFSREGMAIQRCAEGEAENRIPYDRFEMVLETEDLLLLFYGDAVTLVQKKDVRDGSVGELRELLSGTVRYVRADLPAEAGKIIAS